MQAKLVRGKAAFHIRTIGLSVSIVVGAAAFCFLAPNPALASCGGTHISGAHAASAGNGGIHTTTSIGAPTGVGGGGGTLGCANGSSAAAFHGLPVASSGRVVEATAHAARPAMHARAATTTTNVSAHLHAVRPAHRA